MAPHTVFRNAARIVPADARRLAPGGYEALLTAGPHRVAARGVHVN